MKYLLAVAVTISLISCKNEANKMSSEISEEKKQVTLSKAINNEVEDTIDGGMMLLGPVNRDGLSVAPYDEWFTASQKEHVLDTVAIEALKPLLAGIDIKVFMGTWCEDSQREIPALYKILDTTDFNYERLEVVAVSHDKDTPNGLEKGHSIAYVPTIIFIKNGDTLNRIVEYAHQTLEKDMVRILSREDYTPAYTE